MKKTFHSNGKLLLTGEYVVLDGATALAMPTKYGQSLEIISSEKNGIHWNSLNEKGKVWFEEFFSPIDFIASHSESKYSQTLSKILQAARKLNPEFLSESEGIQVRTKLDFPRNWGLGTSSTLINNIANWAEVNAFELLSKSFGGSGYDIAAAQNNFPILYELEDGKPKIEIENLPWDFKNSIFFIHLNKKQDSKEGIKRYRETKISLRTIEEISNISKQLIDCNSLSEFETLITLHEHYISEAIKLLTVKEQFFPDYPKTIKSLGAWGGDFVMATGTIVDMDYFKRKGFNTVIPFKEMIR